MIPFCDSRSLIPLSQEYIQEALYLGRITGDGPFTQKCRLFLQKQTQASAVLMTTSCTDALEMSALLLNIEEGDEIIAPSYTFVSTVNAFVLHGAYVKFVDIDPDTMNINPALVESAITSKTKAILPVHYAGISVDMDPILELGRSLKIAVIEDAAQGVLSWYKGRPLGALGDMGTYSFHNTKNYVMGEGGALIINQEGLLERAEIIREKGTNRAQFIHGQVDKYTWVDRGSSFLPSDLNCALLLGQLEHADEINIFRRGIWDRYHDAFRILENREQCALPVVPEYAVHNAHMYYLKCRDIKERSAYIAYMKEKDVTCVFHYIPLHSSVAGVKYGEFIGEDRYTTVESERLVRLPLFYGMTDREVSEVIDLTLSFFSR